MTITQGTVIETTLPTNLGLLDNQLYFPIAVRNTNSNKRSSDYNLGVKAPPEITEINPE